MRLPQPKTKRETTADNANTRSTMPLALVTAFNLTKRELAT